MEAKEGEKFTMNQPRNLELQKNANHRKEEYNILWGQLQRIPFSMKLEKPWCSESV